MKFEPNQPVHVNLFDTEYVHGNIVAMVAYSGEYNMPIYRVDVDGELANVPEYLLEAAEEYNGDTVTTWKELEPIWSPKSGK